MSQSSDSAIAYITETLGVAFREKLTKHLGGTSVQVPKHTSALTENHPLVMALGRADAKELCAILSGECFYVPTGRRSIRAEQVEAATIAGKPTRSIARELGISDRQVRRLRAQIRERAPMAAT